MNGPRKAKFPTKFPKCKIIKIPPKKSTYYVYLEFLKKKTLSEEVIILTPANTWWCRICLIIKLQEAPQLAACYRYLASWGWWTAQLEVVLLHLWLRYLIFSQTFNLIRLPELSCYTTLVISSANWQIVDISVSPASRPPDHGQHRVGAHWWSHSTGYLCHAFCPNCRWRVLTAR